MEINALTTFTAKHKQPNDLKPLPCKDDGGSQMEKLGLPSVGLYLICLNYELFLLLLNVPCFLVPFSKTWLNREDTDQQNHTPWHCSSFVFFYMKSHRCFNSLLPLHSNLIWSPIRK